MDVSATGVALVESFEGFSSAPYQDSVGVWTIGYGHTGGVHANSPHITKAQATALLLRELNNNYAAPVRRLALPLNQNQFDAVVSFVYNLGWGVLEGSHDFGRLLRARNFHGAADSMLEYDHAGSQRLAGLTRRRVAERALFLKPMAGTKAAKAIAKPSGFRVIDGCPVNATLAPYLQVLKQGLGVGTLYNSLYRGSDARLILHKHGKHDQAEIYATSPPGVANPPGRSTHELRSDGVAYSGPIGRSLAWWQQGIDIDDQYVAEFIRWGSHYGWKLGRPYPHSRVEFHHVNFHAPPQAKNLAMRAKLIRIRATLPRS